MDFVILAGGRGSRFVEEGYQCPKPLISILGRPMIGGLIDMLMRCGADTIYVGANARMKTLIEYLEGLRQQGLPLVVRPIVTENSFCTLKAASEGIEGKFIAVTCDSIFPESEFKGYVRGVEESHSDVALMGLTRFVEDGSPLYARVSADGDVVDYRYGGKPFGSDVIVSAGVYGLSGFIMQEVLASEVEPESLNDFQRLLAIDSKVRVLPYEFSVAFDVDNTHDLKHAECFLNQQD